MTTSTSATAWLKSVTNVLDGSIRRSGNRLRISMQFVNAGDGYQVWSERCDCEIRGVGEHWSIVSKLWNAEP